MFCVLSVAEQVEGLLRHAVPQVLAGADTACVLHNAFIWYSSLFFNGLPQVLVE